MVRLAIPNKGRIAVPIMDLMEKSGLHLLDTGERRLISRTRIPISRCSSPVPSISLNMSLPGLQIWGLPGMTWWRDGSVDVEELLDLQFGVATLVLAVKEDSPVHADRGSQGRKIATEFPGIAQFISQNKIFLFILSGLAVRARLPRTLVLRMQLSTFPVPGTHSVQTGCVIIRSL